MSIKEVNIGSLGQVITGNTPPKKDPTNYGGDYPFIKPTDMTIGKRFVDEWDETYSEKAYEKYKKALIPSGATGVVTIGTVGEKIFQSNQHCFTNQSVNVVIPNENYDEDYVFYVLKLNLNKVLSANPGTSSGRHHVSKSNFCSITIDVVTSKKEQKKIASILSAYDDLIENNLKRIKLLEEAAQRLYKEWFVDFKFPNHENTAINPETGLPDGWERKNYGSLLKKVIRKGKLKKSDYKIKGDYPVIDQGDGFIAGYSNNSEIIQNESLPLVIFGDHTRRVKYIDFPFICGADGTQLLSPKDERLLPSFFYHLTNNIDLSNYAYARHFKFLKEHEVILPENYLIEEFNKKTNSILNQINRLRFYNQNLKEARDLLLPRLMNRTIEV